MFFKFNEGYRGGHEVRVSDLFFEMYILQQVLNMGGKFSFNSVQAGLVVSE